MSNLKQRLLSWMHGHVFAGDLIITLVIGVLLFGVTGSITYNPGLLFDLNPSIQMAWEAAMLIPLLILFSDDLDKALATFVLANGAAATGQKVTIFFTFWGLNVLKKVQKPSVQKDFFGKMFGMMLPSSSLKLKLSQMNMFGMGSRMMRFLMKRKGVDSLESLRSQALAQGVEFIACQMSMDMMGIRHEELLDEVTIGAVPSSSLQGAPSI
jgi:peroxiredoxin family protein